MKTTEHEITRALAGSDAGALPFEPPAWLRSGHAQTVLGRYLFQGDLRLDSVSHEIRLADGDRLCVLESIPGGWTDGDPAAVLVHGLAGCARASYVVRIARRLVRRGIRVVRMNLRAQGRASAWPGASITPAAPRTCARSSAGWRQGPPPRPSPWWASRWERTSRSSSPRRPRIIRSPGWTACSPPIRRSTWPPAPGRCGGREPDLRLEFPPLASHRGHRLHRLFPELGPLDLGRVRSVYEFDDRYTAPRNGFASADDYYARSSALPLIPRIAIPGLVIHAADDPFIPSEPFQQARFPAALRFELTRHGGHLGYVSRARPPGRSALARCPADGLAGRPVGNFETSSRQRAVPPRSGGCQPGSL